MCPQYPAVMDTLLLPQGMGVSGEQLAVCFGTGKVHYRLGLCHCKKAGVPVHVAVLKAHRSPHRHIRHQS